uniref:DUF641 domain-containing protein n=1 Tax=Ananas comosus var. bracteatus TaxID=296719 RepID=A0A6V7NJ22_ANACO|nr:unnamed protein product [Ananas comosus var. bracteatus]
MATTPTSTTTPPQTPFPPKEHDEAETFGERKEGDEDEDEDDDERRRFGSGKRGARGRRGLGRVREMEALMGDVFDTVSAMKRAYVSLQEAHCPWDPDKMRVADAAVVAELRKLGRLRDRFRRSGAGGGRRASASAAPLREAVAPYEAALDDMKRELKAKETEGRMHHRPSGAAGEPHAGAVRVVHGAGEGDDQVLHRPPPSLMRSARWDIAAAVRSIVDAAAAADDDDAQTTAATFATRRSPTSAPPREVRAGIVREPAALRRVRERDVLPGRVAVVAAEPLGIPARLLRAVPRHARDGAGRAAGHPPHVPVRPVSRRGSTWRRCTRGWRSRCSAGWSSGGRWWRGRTRAPASTPNSCGRRRQCGCCTCWPSRSTRRPPLEASKGADFHPDYMESVVRFAGGRVPPAGWWPSPSRPASSSAMAR